MFGRNKEKVEAVTQEPPVEDVFIIRDFGAEYMGGHTAFPKKTDCDVALHRKYMTVEWGRIHKTEITIPYSSITSVTNEDEKRITKTRVFLTGIIPGLLWKKKFRYTVIEYTDMAGIKQGVVIDFHRHAEAVQGIIYQQMIEMKEAKQVEEWK